MRRYWLSPSALQPGDDTNLEICFKDDIFHHIFDVCRQEKGSKFEVLFGDQKAHLVEVTRVEKKRAYAKTLTSREIPAIPTPHIHLAISIPRFPVMEAVVEKAVELGVHTIHPFFSDFSFVRKAAMLPENKTERWNKIVISATQQSGRGELLKIQKTENLEVLLKNFQQTNQTKDRLGLFAYEGTAETSIKKYFHKNKKDGLEEIWVFVGSEGGFSTEEVKKFQSFGLSPITLGDQVLRVETACITLLAILKYEFAIL